ncbi:kinase-like protein [Gigaspora margarita]|uniref:Kinase-like protein n=1 Tax=Gigaspora margarita TaxID=4874 RepID=A0A8H4ESX4_GIGMA|nr:kinase-like protein [Gigaspora margarita]
MAKEIMVNTATLLALYTPVIGTVKLVVGKIYQIYENVECNKELCLVFVTRIKLVECVADLNFAIDVSKTIDREEETQRVDKSLEEVREVSDKIKIDPIKIDQTELSEPMAQTNRGRVFKRIYKSFIEVACKPIDDHNKIEFAIHGKLSQSSQILRFYDHSIINNSIVIVFDWAKRGNLRELYNKYGISWTRKIQIAKDILLGLLFLDTVNIFHHDLRCENVFVLRDLSIKLGNFGCASEIDGNSRNLSQLLVEIIRWIAPELIKKYSNFQGNYEDINVYTFNCEIFGMLLWELCYEALPYAEWNIKQVADHILSGKRERILNGNLNNPADKEIQLEFNEIIQEASEFPIPYDTPTLFNKRTTGFDRKFSDFDDVAEDGSTKRVNLSELIDPRPYPPVKKIYKGYEVAIKYSKRIYAKLSILKKLDTSPYILYFYGYTQLIDNRDVMIFERAEHRSLKEFYDSCDITWITQDMTPKFGNFGHAKILFVGWPQNRWISIKIRKRLLLEKFNNPDDESIQKKLTEIIDKTWQHILHKRITIMELNKTLKELTSTYPILLDDQIYNLSETIEYSNLLNDQIIKENFEYEVEKISKVILWEELEDMEKIGQENFCVVNKAYWKEMDQYAAYEDQRYFLVMEFANNGDLYTFLQLNHDSLNCNQRLNLAFQIARGLSVLHSKEIIYRDLHDTNILIDNGEAKITDFGHARNDNMETNFYNSLSGAISFLAPELLERSSNPRKLPYCKKTDIYSLGFLHWELASSRRLFINTSSFGSMDITSLCISIINGVREEIISGAPEGYINLYSKCWKTNKDERSEIETVY